MRQVLGRKEKKELQVNQDDLDWPDPQDPWG